MHPGDHPDAGRIRRRGQEDFANRLRGRDDRFGKDPHGDQVGLVERARDLVRMFPDRAKRVLAVERLATGDEPDLSVAQDLHPTPSRPPGGRARRRAIECMHSCAGPSRAVIEPGDVVQRAETGPPMIDGPVQEPCGAA